MKAHGGGVGFDVSHTVTGYPWSNLGEGLVVDVSACLPLSFISSLLTPVV
jgi:hypothetical protein